MKIAFFVSNHGFGHINRTIPVMEELIMRGHEIILITGDMQAKTAINSLHRKVQIIRCDTDAGLVVVPGTLKIDQKATTERIKHCLSIWPSMIANAPDADCYVVDIVPWALLAAKEKGIPSFFMASFTWIEQYEPFLQDDYLDYYRIAFLSRGRVLFYELVNDSTKKLFGEGEKIGFVARPYCDEKVREILKKHKQPIVFTALGCSNMGLDIEVDVSSLPYDFITTSKFKLKGNNVTCLEASVENTQDYIKAADYCITKPGWTTIAEAILSNTKLALLEREDSPEDKMTVEQLKKNRMAITINEIDLRQMDCVLNRMKTFEYSKEKYENSYVRIADIICSIETK